MSEPIKPISHLKAHAAEILPRDRGPARAPDHHPERRSQAVAQDRDRFERMHESVALLKILALGNRQIEAGRVQPAGEVVARLRDRRRAD